MPHCATTSTTPTGSQICSPKDAVWESSGLGRCEGRKAVRSFFRGAPAIFSFAIHYSLNSHIEVEGDTARARWYLFMPCTVVAGNQAVWRAGIDHETYARVDGTWMFRHKRSESLMSVPFETGWAKARFAAWRAIWPSRGIGTDVAFTLVPRSCRQLRNRRKSTHTTGRAILRHSISGAALLRNKSAVNHQLGTGDKRRFVGRQE